MKKIILGIITILILIICLFAIATCHRQYTAQQEEIQAQQELLFNQKLQDVQIPEEWYKQDGYDNISDWWNDLIALKTKYANIASETIIENGDILTEKQKQSVAEHSDAIISASSIQEINNLVWSIEEIKIQALDAQEQKELQFVSDANNFKNAGVIFENGYKYTWYSTNEGSAGYVPGIPGRYTDPSGIIRDGNDYIVVASSTHNKGTVVPTPFGEGKVYDTGCALNVIDIYTNF